MTRLIGALPTARSVRTNLPAMILVATLLRALVACAGDPPKEHDIEVGSTAAVDTSNVEVDCGGGCDDGHDAALVDDDVAGDRQEDAIPADDVAPTPLATGLCRKILDESLASVLPCESTQTCCSTAVQYDPCGAGAKVTTAPSRWQLFRFWTNESAACVDGKTLYFHAYPREPRAGESSIETMTWAPTCPGASKAMDWATVQFPEDGSELPQGSVALMTSPFAENYNPCGIARVGQNKIVALGCNQFKTLAVTSYIHEYWSSPGNGECCDSEGALVMVESGVTQAVLQPPSGFTTWAIPTAIPKSSTAQDESLSVASLALQLPLLDYDERTSISHWYIKIMQPAQISTQGCKLKVATIFAPAFSQKDYYSLRKQIAVLDADNMAWMYDKGAPGQQMGMYGPTEQISYPYLGMVIDGGTKSVFLGDAGEASEASIAHPFQRVLASNGDYVVLSQDRIARINKSGKVLTSVDFGPGSSSKSEKTWHYIPIPAPDGGIFTTTFRPAKGHTLYSLGGIIRLAPNGDKIWSWKFNDAGSWARPTQMVLHNGVLHLFGVLVPEAHDSTWAWHLRLDAATGKELCPGQMPGKP